MSLAEFGAGCGGTCDLRIINLDGGSIFIEETFSNVQFPGSSQNSSRGGPPSFSVSFPPGLPGSGTLTDVIIGGTGIFEGATGTLSGTVRFAGLKSQIKLSGTITLAF